MASGMQRKRTAMSLTGLLPGNDLRLGSSRYEHAGQEPARGPWCRTRPAACRGGSQGEARAALHAGLLLSRVGPAQLIRRFPGRFPAAYETLSS